MIQLKSAKKITYRLIYIFLSVFVRGLFRVFLCFRNYVGTCKVRNCNLEPLKCSKFQFQAKTGERNIII